MIRISIRDNMMTFYPALPLFQNAKHPGISSHYYIDYYDNNVCFDDSNSYQVHEFES